MSPRPSIVRDSCVRECSTARWVRKDRWEGRGAGQSRAIDERFRRSPKLRSRRQFRLSRRETGADDPRRGAGRGRWMFGIPGTSTHLWECREVRSRVSRGLCRAVLLSASKSDRTSSAGRREAFFGAFSRRFLRRDFGLGRKVSPKIIQGAQTHRPCAGPADSGTRGACASAGGSLGAVSVGPPTNAEWKASLDTPPRCVSASSWSESCPRRTMIW